MGYKKSGRWIFTSESVTEGHPDKVCDQISDAILDAIIREDPKARVACETVCTTGLILILGEVSTKTYVDIPAIARDTVRKIGFEGQDGGFDYKTCAVMVSLDEQSGDIAQGVDVSLETRRALDTGAMSTGAGDQGLMFGYANTDTKEFMPLPISLAHDLTRKLAQVRKSGQAPYLRPDGKSQVSVEYEGANPVRIDTVVLSAQHSPDISLKELTKNLRELVIDPTLPVDLIDENTKYFVNPTGRFVIGGPQGDSGLTGRKIIVDTYGGFAPHGGGAFSGKDPTKVDRSASYAARYIAKNIVAAGLAKECEIQLAYAIGVAHPVSLFVDTFGTGIIPDEKISGIIGAHFDLRPDAMIRDFDLLNPIYKKTAAYGHFGRRDELFSWEKTDKAQMLAEVAKR